jgi:hypothetical protein
MTSQDAVYVERWDGSPVQGNFCRRSSGVGCRLHFQPKEQSVLEALESRQMFSMTLAAALPTGEPVDTPPAVTADADSVAAKPKPKPRPAQEPYLVVTMSDVLVS